MDSSVADADLVRLHVVVAHFSPSLSPSPEGWWGAIQLGEALAIEDAGLRYLCCEHTEGAEVGAKVQLTRYSPGAIDVRRRFVECCEGADEPVVDPVARNIRPRVKHTDVVVFLHLAPKSRHVRILGDATGRPEIDERANGGKYNLAQTAQRSLMVILDAVHLFE